MQRWGVHISRSWKAWFTQERLHGATVVCVLLFLAFAILWKGGKALDATWLLTTLAWLCTVDTWAFPRRERTGAPVALWLLLMLSVFWIVASFAQSSTGNYGFDEVLRSGSLVLLCLWSLRQVAAGGEEAGVFQQRFAGVLTVSAVLASCIGFVVYVLQPVERGVGSFFDFRFHTDYWPNAWAEFLLFAWPLALWWFSRKGRRLAALFFLGWLAASLLLSYSRAGVIAFAAQIVLWGVLALRGGGMERVRAFSRSALPRVLAVTAVAMLIFAAANQLRGRMFPVQSLTEKAMFAASEGTSSVSERRQFWGQAVRLALDRPLYGWGPYSFRFVQPRYQEQVLATSDHPHNVFLKLAAEQGIPAAFLFAGMLTLIAAGWLVRRRPAEPETMEIGMFLFLAVSGVLMHNLVDYNLQFVGIALPFWMAVGMLAAQLPADPGVPVRLRRTTEVLLATLLMLTAVVEGRFLVLSSLGRHAEARGDSAAALRWYDESRAERFSRDLHLSRALLRLERGELPQAREALGDAFTQNGEDCRAWKLRGDVCRRDGDAVCALEAYEGAEERCGWNDVGVLRAFAETLEESAPRSALDARQEKFRTRMQAFAAAIRQNAHFIALSGNTEEFLRAVGDLSRMYPDDEPLYVVLGAQASRNAERERARFQARPPGMLW